MAVTLEGWARLVTYFSLIVLIFLIGLLEAFRFPRLDCVAIDVAFFKWCRVVRDRW